MNYTALCKSVSSQLADEQTLALIEQYTRRPMSADEVYVFSLILCDNEIDRDFECFDIEALYTLQKLFLGKTGIFDHNPKGANQTARIFAAEVVADPVRKTRHGEPYTYLKAMAYMVRCDKNADLILEIDAGIKKEVSVGCAVSTVTCSVCGANVKEHPCTHKPGRTYQIDGGQLLCYHILSQPTDAYEWSFVAVPAQPAAGVVKGYRPAPFDERDADAVDALQEEGDVLLERHKAARLSALIRELRPLADIGRQYIEDTRTEIIKLAALQHAPLEGDVLASAMRQMDFDELRALKKAMLTRAEGTIPPLVQLYDPAGEMPAAPANSPFKI